jgi:predicted ATPase
MYEADWSPGDLNVLVGPNASGKTNLLRLLELLSHSARGRLGKYIRSEGGIEPLLWDGSSPSLSIRLHIPPIDPRVDPSRADWRYEVELARIGKGSSYRIERERLADYYKFEKGLEPGPFKALERQANRAFIFDDERRALEARQEDLSEEETLLSVATGPFAANRKVADFRLWLENITVYRDISTSMNSPLRQPAITSLETQVASDGSNLIPVLHTLYSGNREFKRELKLAMQAAFGDEFEDLSFPPAADQQIQLRVQWRSLRREQSAADISDGTLRFLFLISVLGNPNQPSLIAIDEPETGLHPSMLPIVAEFAREASRRTQVIFTTHSPAMLDAFGTRPPTVTVVDWREARTRFRTCAGEELDRWLQSYTIGELYRSGQLET